MVRYPVVLLLFLSSALAVKREAKGLEKIAYIRHQFGMELGSGYDSPNDIVLPNLITEEDRHPDHLVKAYQDYSSFSWRMVNSVAEVRDMLGIAGRVSLSVGEEDVAGASVEIEGHYMKDLTVSNNDLLVAAVFRYNTRAESIPDASLKGRIDCRNLDPAYRGTHFIRSIVYGGEFVASIKISMRSRTEIDKYGGSIKASSVIGYDFNAFIEQMTSLSKTEIRTDIRIMSSCGIQLIPSNISRFEKLVSEFPAYLSRNCPDGHPMQAELVPIKFLEKCNSHVSSPNLKVNDWELRPLFDYVAVLYDDIRISRRKLDDLIFMLDTISISPDHLKRIKTLDTKLLNRTLKLLENKERLKSTDPNELYEVGFALKDYYPDSGTLPIPRYFEREVLRLRDLLGSCPLRFQNIKGNCYRLVTERHSWFQANQKCGRYGGYLASFNPEELDTFKRQTGTIREPFWIGLNRTVGNVLKWNNEEPMEQVNVFRSSPYVQGQHCMMMRADYSVIDQDLCSNSRTFVCRVTLKG